MYLLLIFVNVSQFESKPYYEHTYIYPPTHLNCLSMLIVLGLTANVLCL